MRVRPFFYLLLPLLSLAFGGCAGLIEAPLESKLNSFQSLPLSAKDREMLLGWMAENSAFAFSHAQGVEIIEEPGAEGRYLVQIQGTQKDLAGGLASAVTRDGYYVTAGHVLKDDDPVLLLWSGPEGLVQQKARVVWRSPEDWDIALIKGPPRRTCFSIAVEKPRVGATVLAGGATGGDSAGGILAVDGERVMHSAPLRRGDSGGPLINTAGELVGVNRAIHFDVFRGRRNEAVQLPVEMLWDAIERDRGQ